MQVGISRFGRVHRCAQDCAVFSYTECHLAADAITPWIESGPPKEEGRRAGIEPYLGARSR